MAGVYTSNAVIIGSQNFGIECIPCIRVSKHIDRAVVAGQAINEFVSKQVKEYVFKSLLGLKGAVTEQKEQKNELEIVFHRQVGRVQFGRWAQR